MSCRDAGIFFFMSMGPIFVNGNCDQYMVYYRTIQFQHKEML